jgi:hypothetical protein
MITGMDLNTLYSVLNAILISLGLWMLVKLFWMFIYQLKYGENYGDLYISNKLTKQDKARLKKEWSFKIWILSPKKKEPR